MAQPQPVSSPRMTVAQYLATEQLATTKHEFLDGTVIAMPGASRNHVQISSKLGPLIDRALEGSPCEYLDQDVQVRIPELRVYTYPDAVIACPPLFDEGPTAVLLNPKVIFEVLSPSTEGYDRGAKFRKYRNIATFEEYVLISSEEFVVEVYRKPDWGPHTFEGLDEIARIESVGIDLPLRELYSRLLKES